MREAAIPGSPVAQRTTWSEAAVDPDLVLVALGEHQVEGLLLRDRRDGTTETVAARAMFVLIGFTVSYFLVFHVRSLLWQIALFLVCTVPFWTSNIIRMISWIPFLGRNGLFNQMLMGAGLTQQPLEFLLFSDFAVILSYVHLFTLFGRPFSGRDLILLGGRHRLTG